MHDPLAVEKVHPQRNVIALSMGTDEKELLTRVGKAISHQVDAARVWKRRKIDHHIPKRIHFRNEQGWIRINASPKE